MNHSLIKIGLILCCSGFLFSCASNREAVTEQAEPQQSQQREQPSVIELLTEMDTDKDGKLSLDETKGPLREQFTTIDVNNDGFLDVEELKNMPEPKRKQSGERPPRGGQGGRPGGPPPRN